jgi:hypothetical protein
MAKIMIEISSVDSDDVLGGIIRKFVVDSGGEDNPGLLGIYIEQILERHDGLSVEGVEAWPVDYRTESQYEADTDRLSNYE